MRRHRLIQKLTNSFSRKWWFVILVSLVMVAFGAIVFVFFYQWVDMYINHELPLAENSMTFRWWKSPPVHPIMRVYIYNVTNADEFLNNGSKPIVEELGPYVYVETWDKVNLDFNENHTVSFNQRKIFVFDPEQSAGSEEDMVVVPNIPMLSATSQSKHAARFLRLAMASIMDILKVKPFVEVSVGQLLWGYEDPLIKLAKDVVPNDQKLPYEKFGLLYGIQQAQQEHSLWQVARLMEALRVGNVALLAAAAVAAVAGAGEILAPLSPGHVGRVPLKRAPYPLDDFGLRPRKNGTNSDRVTIFTGKSDITRYGIIDRYNGNRTLTHWKTQKCNRLDGSDGSIFPPHIRKQDTIHVYDKDLCRLLPLVFEKEVETSGDVPGFRFSPPLDVFADVETNPENDCFCPGGPPCAPSGFFNVSLCQYDSPVLLSFPHFYLAPEKYREAFDGISPAEKEKHQFYLDVQPNMGVSLRARARIQINLAVSQVVDIKQVATFPDIIFPIMWFEDGVEKLPSEVTNLLSLATRAPPIARAALSYGLFAIGGLLLALAVACLVRSSRRQETLRLQGSSHYSKPSTQPSATSAAAAAAAASASANGKGKSMEMLNPTFTAGPDNTNGAARN